MNYNCRFLLTADELDRFVKTHEDIGDPIESFLSNKYPTFEDLKDNFTTYPVMPSVTLQPDWPVFILGDLVSTYLFEEELNRATIEMMSNASFSITFTNQGGEE